MRARIEPGMMRRTRIGPEDEEEDGGRGGGGRRMRKRASGRRWRTGDNLNKGIYNTSVIFTNSPCIC